jgi:hypothetical protein
MTQEEKNIDIQAEKYGNMMDKSQPYLFEKGFVMGAKSEEAKAYHTKDLFDIAEVKSLINKSHYDRCGNPLMITAKLKVNEEWFDENLKRNITKLPTDAMKNLVGYLDTPIGRRKYPPEVIENIQAIRNWLEENKF